MMKRMSLLAVVLLFAVACGPNLKSEQQKWSKYQELKSDLVAEWPALKPVVEEHHAQAQKLMTQAQSMTDEEKKAEKMKEANEKAGELLDKLRQVRDRLRSTQKQLKKLASMRIPKSKSKKRLSVITNTSQTLSEVNTMMATAQTTSLQETQALAKSAVSKLITAEGNVKRFIKSVSSSKVSLKKKEKKKK